MKIAILSFEYPPDTGFGGIGTYSWYHARALAKLGHEVHVLAGSLETADMRKQEHDGVTVYRTRSDGTLMKWAKRLEKRQLSWTQNRLETGISMFAGMKKLLKQTPIDIVEMPECGAEGLLVNRFCRVPTLIRFHSPADLIMPFYQIKKADHKWCSRTEKFAIKGAKHLSACSQFLADEVHNKMGVGRHIEVIPNGIDLELFDSQEQVDARDKFGIPKDRPMIFFAARIEERKGSHLFKEIVGTILEKHDVSFVFAGGDIFGYMENDILPSLKQKKLKGDVYYIGKLDLTDVRSCLAQTDIFFFPSTWENHPYSCLEAMASGRAIVSSDCGGMPEVFVNGENGLLAENENPKAFIEALDKLISDQALCQKLGAGARETVEVKYRDTIVAKRTADYYQKCISG